MNNGHFAGKIKKFVDDAVGKAKGTEGSLYKIMNSHGFYDVADENNGLADWQRASVPDYNQHRISDLCNAIAEMIGDMLGNDEYGILYPNLDNIIGKLDLNATKTAAGLDVVGGALGGLTGGASESTRQAMGNLTAILMGGFAYDPDILPPISLNLPGLPLDFANMYPMGAYPADWTFLYNHETVKSPTYYAADDGTVAIGAGIKLNTGGNARQRVMKLIFSVPDVDENGVPKGDALGGVSVGDFNKMYEVSDKQYGEIKDKDEYKVKLTDVQMEVAYFRMVQLTIWGAITNPDNWAYLHWGCLAHNSCPTAVKTAICSFLKTNGFAIDQKVCPAAGFISYCINTGMAYLTGSDKCQYLYLLPGMRYKNDKGDDHKVGSGKEAYKSNTENTGVPVDKELADLHFTLAADILSHLTYGSNPNAAELRQRRVDEANLIYNYVGYPTMKFGDAAIPTELSANAMEKRGFGKLINAKILVFPNSNSTIPLDTGNCKIINWAEKGSNEMSDITIATIQYILAKAKLPGFVVTSVYRSPEAQTRAMFNNRQKENGGIPVNYGPRGREVDQAYTDVSKRVNGGKCLRINDPAAQQEAKDNMTAVCYKWLNVGKPVSNHGNDQSVLQAVDLGPGSTKKYFKNYTEDDMMRMQVACWDTYQEGYLRCYLGPKEYGGPKTKDPAFHIEVWQDPNKKHPPVNGKMLGPPFPSVACKITDKNLKNKNTWDMAYVNDQTLV